MKNSLETFLKNANLTMARNIVKQVEIDGLEREKQLLKEKMMTEQKENKEIDFDSKVVKRITELGFKINSYHQEEHPHGEDYYVPQDIFYCEYKDWVFEVKWMDDPDIEEGILGLYNPINKITNEKLSYYCDLYCNNTPKIRIQNLLKVFEIGKKAFIQEEYGHYIELPSLLREKGYDILTKDYEFEIGDNKGYISLNNGVIIRIYRAWGSDLKMVITNDEKWDVNSYNGMSLNNKIGYFFEYKGRSCLEELCKCINAFKEHLDGNYGFFEKYIVKIEDGTEREYRRYYKNYDFLDIFSNIIKKVKSKYYDKWNHRFIQYDKGEFWDSRGYNEDAKTPNHYIGLEIYETVLFSINESAQWTVGEESIQYLIHFEYDKRKDKENCVMTIEQWISPISESLSVHEQIDKNSPYYKGMFTMKGKFTELTEKLDTFLRQNLADNGIVL